MEIFPKRAHGKKGLTLIELLIVIVLLGVLSTLVAGNLMTSLRRGRDSRRKGDINGISKALEVYNADFHSYPLSDENGQILGCGDGDDACSWGGEFSITANGEEVIYMAKLPNDPSGAEYEYISDGERYGIFTKLENADDPDYRTNGANCGGVSCTYGATSVNTSVEELAPGGGDSEPGVPTPIPTSGSGSD
jgi:type II secretion system protein G